MSREVVLPPGGVVLPGLGQTRGQSLGRVSRTVGIGQCLRLEGDSEQRKICPQSPGFCKQYCSASFGIPQAWRGEVAANVIYGAVMVAGGGEGWRHTWGWSGVLELRTHCAM